jgi:hypothetical protein
MNAKWENQFRDWARPPGEAEERRCEHTISEIKAAIKNSTALSKRDIKVFTQGSYQNNTNVRLNSDVDVSVACYDTFFHDYPSGKDDADFNVSPATYHYEQFKNEVESALITHFGPGTVTRGNKAFDIKARGRNVEADVASFFEHRRYDSTGNYISGVELRADKDQSRVINWPEQHYENGTSKNNATGRRYKAMVRVLKRLCIEMEAAKVPASLPITGFLIECLVFNVPNIHFSEEAYSENLEDVLAYLYKDTQTYELCSDWGEVSELKYLFRGKQKWTREQAHSFILAAWEFTR